MPNVTDFFASKPSSSSSSNVYSVSEQLTVVNDQVLLSPNEENGANAVPMEDRGMCEDEEEDWKLEESSQTPTVLTRVAGGWAM